MFPLLFICFTIICNIDRYANEAFERDIKKTVESACGLTEYLVTEAQRRSIELARNGSCLQYLLQDDTQNYTATSIIQECGRVAESGIYEPYIIPVDDTRLPLGRGQVPSLYASPASRHWGILGKLATNPTDLYALEAQPHQDSGDAIALAVGVPVHYNGKVTGYVVTDIKRSAFFNINPGRIGAIQDLLITDTSGCIVFSLLNASLEGQFIDSFNNAYENNMLISPILNNSMCISVIYPKSAMNEFSARLSMLTIWLIVISVCAAFLFSFFISRSISHPITTLISVMHQVEKGNLSVRSPEPRTHVFSHENDDVHFLVRHFNDMIARIDVLMEEAVLKQKFLRAAEVQALQSQINPHFLYNTLSSIRSMAKLQGAGDAAEMVTILARILREGISGQGDMSTVKQSIALAKDYFLIEAYRWPDRFSYHEHIDETVADCPIPKLVVQPVVENALIHGLEAKEGKGELDITAIQENDTIVIRVSDTGVGMTEDELAALKKSIESHSLDVEQKKEHGSSGIALINTHRRLKLLYGRDAGLKIYSYPGEGTVVEIRYKPENSNV